MSNVNNIPDEDLRRFQASGENNVRILCALESIWLIVSLFIYLLYTISGIFGVVATSIFACGCCVHPDSSDEEKGMTLNKSYYLLMVAFILDFIFILIAFVGGGWVIGVVGLVYNLIRALMMFQIRKGSKAFMISASRGGSTIVAQPQFQQQQMYNQNQNMVNNPYNNQAYPGGQQQGQPVSYAQPVIASAVVHPEPQGVMTGIPVNNNTNHQQQVYVDPQQQQQQQQQVNIYDAGIPSYDYVQTQPVSYGQPVDNNNNNNNNNNNGPPSYNF